MDVVLMYFVCSLVLGLSFNSAFTLESINTTRDLSILYFFLDNDIVWVTVYIYFSLHVHVLSSVLITVLCFIKKYPTTHHLLPSWFTKRRLGMQRLVARYRIPKLLQYTITLEEIYNIAALFEFIFWVWKIVIEIIAEHTFYDIQDESFKV